MSYRKPPKPPFYVTAIGGQCKWCGGMIYRPNGTVNVRANWHPSCVRVYKEIHWPKETRKAVYRRDQGICVDCGIKGCPPTKRGAKVVVDWDVDHIKPLVEAKGDISYWKLDNLATRCKDCHKAKSIAETKARAKARREAKKLVDKPD